MPDYSNELKTYVSKLSSDLADSPFEDLSAAARILMDARNAGNWIFIAGNGGSASTASHFANDLVKGLSNPTGDGSPGKKRFKAMALCDHLPIMTALANDYEYAKVFEEQLMNYASPEDVFLSISGSGNSPNVVAAAKKAVEMGLKVISFSGRGGGKMKELADISVEATSHIMEEIEDIHLAWEHAIITVLRSEIAHE
jgi:D-sedoheptulose 7-phosphate isomerase